MGYLSGAGLIVVQALAGLVLALFVLRVVLPLSGARFRNPICQLIYQWTNPILVPMTRLIRNWRSISVAGIICAWLISALITLLILFLVGAELSITMVLLHATATLLQFVLSLYFWTILIAAVMSLFSPDRSNPLVELVNVLANPVLRPFRRLPPKLQNIDLSPMWALLLIRLTQYSLTYIGFAGLLI